MKVVIIPARGGSKRIQDKNIRNFLGIPIIIRTIRFLNQMNFFDRIIISTDSNRVMNCIKNEPGIEISQREDTLATDSANIIDVISAEIVKNGISPDSKVCCIYAPNPFLDAQAIKIGLDALNLEPLPKYVASVTTYPFPVQRSLHFEGIGDFLEMAEPKYLLTHSQNLSKRFHETAQFWWANAKTWIDKEPMQMRVRGIYIPRWMSQDIDTYEDWHQAELRFQILEKMKKESLYEFSRQNIVTRLNHEE